MILAKPEILRQIHDGRIRIEPYDEDAVGPASIDLTLDNKLRVFNTDQHITRADIDYKTLAKLTDIIDGYLLEPGELVLGITKETIALLGDVRLAELALEIRPDRTHESYRGSVPGSGDLEQADSGNLQRRAE